MQIHYVRKHAREVINDASSVKKKLDVSQATRISQTTKKRCDMHDSPIDEAKVLQFYLSTWKELIHNFSYFEDIDISSILIFTTIRNNFSVKASWTFSSRHD